MKAFGGVLCETDITSTINLTLKFCTASVFSYQVSKRNKTTPKGTAHATEQKNLPFITSFIGELQISHAMSRLVIFCHN